MKVTFKDNSKELLQAMGEAVERALTRIGSEVEGRAKELAPVDTGLLRNSITWALDGEEPAIKEYSDDDDGRTGKYEGTAEKSSSRAVYIGTNVEYAKPVELGTYKMDAQPFLKPALLGAKKTFHNIVLDALKGGGQ